MARHSVGISVAFVQLLFWCNVYIYINSWSIQLPLSYLLWPIKRKQRFERKIAFLTFRKMFSRRLFTITVVIVLGKNCPHRENVTLAYIPSLVPSGLCRELPSSVVWPQRMLLLQLRLYPQLHRGTGVLSEGEVLSDILFSLWFQVSFYPQVYPDDSDLYHSRLLEVYKLDINNIYNIYTIYNIYNIQAYDPYSLLVYRAMISVVETDIGEHRLWTIQYLQYLHYYDI